MDLNNSKRMEDLTHTVIEAWTRANANDHRKIDPVPVLDESTSYGGWKKEVLIWSKAKGRQDRKTQLLIEYLKKCLSSKGLRDLAINKFIEHYDFEYENPNASEIILEKVKEHFEESRWKKTLSLVKECRNMKHK